MNHQERTTIEILKRINDIEKKLTTIGNHKTTISYGDTSHSANERDHRLLSNLNSEDYMHLTGSEYRSVVSGVRDHGSLTGLLDNDHPQYIRHGIAGYEWDMLAAEMNEVSGQFFFERKGIDEIRNKITEKLFPQTDSIDAMMFYRSDGVTPVIVVDTLNQRIGIGAQPATTLHVDGTVTIENGGLLFDSSSSARILSNSDLILSADNGLFFNSDVVLSGHANIRSETFAPDVYGWSVQESGDAYFRNVKVNKINARIVSTGIEQYVGGRQTMCKSASPLTLDFTVPKPESTAMLHVEPFADYPFIHVFADGDIVRLLHVSLYNGLYNTSDCWGTVALYMEAAETADQVYTFTRSASPDMGSATAGTTIPAGELVLDFGVSGDGYIVSTVV